MALLFQTKLVTPQGFTLDNAYGRVAVLNNINGNTLNYEVQIFASKEAFESGALPIAFDREVLSGTTDYDYDTDSKDILNVAHDQLIALLAKQEIVATKDLV